MKGRNNLRTYKVRTKINKNDLNFFYKKKNLLDLKYRHLKNKLIEKFIFDSYKKKITPKVLIDYNRLVYILGLLLIVTLKPVNLTVYLIMRMIGNYVFREMIFWKLNLILQSHRGFIELFKAIN
jgi:hypothetical protein